MKLLYHGTGVGSALQIAVDGAILCPWEQEIKRIKAIERFRNLSTQELEEMVLKHASSVYADHEVGHRVMAISLAPSLSASRDYATHFEQFPSTGGGVILGFEADRTLLSRIPEDWEKRMVVYIPRKMEIENLKEIYLFPIARAYDSVIREAFAKYNPQMFHFREV